MDSKEKTRSISKDGRNNLSCLLIRNVLGFVEVEDEQTFLNA
jgi:hypothetical protein